MERAPFHLAECRTDETTRSRWWWGVVNTRGRVAILENAVDIERSPEDVFDYCTYVTHEPEWNPRTKRVKKVTDGPIGLGTRYEAEWIKGSPMLLEHVRFERPTAWDTVGRSSRLDAKSEGRISAVENGAHLTMVMELQPKGALRMVLPVLRRLMHGREQRNLAAIKAALET
jgi:Polyketide cyclase / dehydrase and lipid transport